MAYAFSRSGRLVTRGDANSLPAGDWSLGGWVQIDGAGTAAPMLLGQAAAGTAGYALNYYEGQYADEALRYRFTLSLRDDAGFASRLDSNGWPAARSAWQHVLVQRAAGVIRLYVDGAADAQTAPAYGATTVAADNVFGLLGSLCLAEWAHWERALGAEEIAALAKGYSPLFFPRGRKWRLPMVREFHEPNGALTLQWTDVAIAAHPRMVRPAGQGGPAAGVAFSVPTPGAAELPADWAPPYRAVAGNVWHSGAVAGRTCC